MTHSHAQVQVGLRIGRSLLPWVAVVFASATLAYAVNGAMAGDPSAGARRPDVQVARSGARQSVVATVATWTRRSSRRAA
jgi:hypothetical protein